LIDGNVQFEVLVAPERATSPVVPFAPAASTIGQRDGSFPLIALLQLAAFSAALAACIDGRRLIEVIDQNNIVNLAVAVGASMVAGFVAVLLGFGHLRRWRTALAAGGIGALHAPAILAAYAAPAAFWRAGPAVAVLLISTIVLRVRSA
jgi:hypothetical protein